MKGCEFLNDTYLYEMPEDELIYLAYEDVISALIRRPRDILQLSGVRKFFADCLGVLLTNSKKEKEYEEMQARRVNQELKAQSLGVSVVLFLAGAGLLAVATPCSSPGACCGWTRCSG